MKHLFFFFGLFICSQVTAQNKFIISPEMVYNITAHGDAWILFDNQQISPGTYACDIPQTDNQWQYFDASFNYRTFVYPATVIIDLGANYDINQICVDDASDATGLIEVAGGDPLNWTTLFSHNNVDADCHPVSLNSRYLRFIMDNETARGREFSIYGPQTNNVVCPPAITICDVQTDCNCPRMNMEEFIGSNNNIDVPASLTNAVGFVRNYQHEYFNWGYDDTTYVGYPNDEYSWAPTKDTRYDHDFTYQSIHDMGVGIGAAMHHAPPYLSTFEYFNGDPNWNAAIPYADSTLNVYDFLHIIHRKPFDESIYPITPNMVVDQPDAYIEYSDIFYQFSSRYGYPGNPENMKVDPTTNVAKNGLGIVQYVENWNEPDKWWHYFWVDGFDFLDPSIEEELGYYSPFELAAKASAEFDGHGSTNGIENIVSTRFPNGIPDGARPVGLQNSNGNMKFVMGGLSEVNLDYVRAMKFWFEHNRPDIGFPFDVINFHEYSNDGGDAPLGSAALSPEDDDLRGQMAEVVEYRDRYMPGVEVWLSEFGYDTNPNSPQSADCTLFCNDCNSQACYDKFMELQGQWDVRSFLELAAAGVDRAMVFNMRDDSPITSWGLYETSGLSTYMDDNYVPKKAWYYIATMKHATEGLQYDPSFVHPDPNVRIYKFTDDCNNPNKTVYAIWSPTSITGDNSPIVADYSLPFITGDATLITMENLDVDGIQQTMTPDCNGNYCVDVSERPIFVVQGDAGEDYNGCDCNFLPYTIDNQNASAVQDEQNNIGEPFCNLGNVMQSNWNSAAGNELVVDLGTNTNIDFLFAYSEGLNHGNVEIYTGSPGNWQLFNNWDVYYPTPHANKWKSFAVGLQSQFIRFVIIDSNITINEIAVCGYPTCATSVTTNLMAQSCIPSDIGVTTQNLFTASGCDSTVITTTILIPSDETYLSFATCDPSEAGVSVLPFVNQFGCDSIVTIDVTLLPSDQTFLEVFTCDATQVGTTSQTLSNQIGCDSIVTTTTLLQNGDNTFLSFQSCDPNDVGTFTNVLPNQFGCDSVITTTVALLPSDQTFLSFQTCDPSQAGTTTQNLINQVGCDSTVSITTTLLPSQQTDIEAQTCNPSEAGITTETLATFQGCDSIVITNTSLVPSVMTAIFATSCDAADVGQVVETLNSVAGCDSIVTTTTTLLPSQSTALNATTCDQNQVGVFVQNLQTWQGCDSTVTTSTTLLPSDVLSINQTSCNQNDVGTEVLNLINQFGCDSTVTITTTFSSSDATANELSTCDQNEAGVFVDDYTNQFGCDSIVTTTVSFFPSTSSEMSLFTCDQNEAGIFTTVLTNFAGCDSVVTTNVLLQNSDAIFIELSSCDPSQAGTSVNNFTNQFGCDSTVTTTTTLLPSHSTAMILTTCDPNEVGVFVENLFTWQGCDSTITTTVELVFVQETFLDETTCDLNEVGSEEFTYQGTGGCDSIVTVTTTFVGDQVYMINSISCDGPLVDTVYYPVDADCDSIVITNYTLLPSSTNNLDAAICEGDVLQIGGSIYDEAGTYSDTLTASNGCDSIVNLILDVYDDIFIEQDSIINSGQPYLNDTTVVDTYVDENGCFSTVTTNFIVNPDGIFNAANNFEVSLFPNPVSGELYLTIDLSATMRFDVAIYNTLGQLVRNLVVDEKLNPGTHSFEQNVQDWSGGSYYMVVKTEQSVLVEKFIVVK